MRTLDGRWFELDAAALDDTSGSVAVVMQPAPPQSIRDAVLRALGLSDRERQVALHIGRKQLWGNYQVSSISSSLPSSSTSNSTLSFT